MPAGVANMKSSKSCRGEATLLVLAAVAVVGAALFLFRPRASHGDSRRADASVQATAAVDATTTKQGAEAAASVVKIGEAAAAAPHSLENTFISREVPLALAKLPPPDASALIAAERRKVAVLEGRVEETHRLYNDALKRADALAQEKADALAQRRAVDGELSRVAAERLGALRERNGMVAVVILALLLIGYIKFTHISPGGLSSIVKDLRSGEVQPIHAVDAVANRFTQWLVSRKLKLEN